MVVSVKAVGINYPDVLVISGKYQVLPPRPFTPGKDLAGIVKDVGVNVKDFQAGDRVMSQVENGAFAEGIGRASCRDRVCQYVLISEVDVSLKKTTLNTPRQ